VIEPSRSWKTESWLLRSYYFIEGGSGAFLIPFMTLFYRSRGFSGLEIGWLATVAGLCTMLAAPLAARWSGRGVRQRRAIQLMLLASASAILLLSQQTLFLWLALALAAYNLASAGIGPAADTMTVQFLASTAQGGFGGIRVWMSAGWALCAVLGGWMIQHFSFLSIFLAAAGASLVGALVLGGVRLPVRVMPPELARSKRSAWRSLSKPAVAGLALALFLAWMTQNGISNFEPLYMKGTLGASETIIGIASTLGAVIELGGMFWADRLARRFGPARLLAISFLISMFDMLLVMLFPAIATILLVHAIGGISFSFFSVGSVNFLNQNTEPGETATVMALIMVTMRALVGIIASPINGMIFDTYGGYILYFLAFAGFTLALLSFSLIVLRREGKRV
jgi:PPP family 3-phenylpropionic acid transporter